MRTNIPAIIPKMHGIMKAHNVQGRAHGLVQYRRLVCSCETAVCDCFDPITWNPDMQHIEDVDNMEVDEANLDADNIDEPNVDNREAPISSASEGDWVAVSLKAASGRRRVYIGQILTVEDSRFNIRYVSVPLDSKRTFYSFSSYEDLDSGVPASDCFLLPQPQMTMEGPH